MNLNKRILSALQNTYYGMEWLTTSELATKLSAEEKDILIAVANLASDGVVIVKGDKVRQKLIVDMFEEMGLH